MKAWVIHDVIDIKSNPQPLKQIEIPTPELGPKEILIANEFCGMCHTELDEIEGRTPPPAYPTIPGHQAVGRIVKLGPGVEHFKVGDRVGIAWIYSSCGTCEYCKQGLDNLCSNFKATGRDANGGYAEYIRIHEDFAFIIPDEIESADAAPLLCAGAIGFRSLRLTELKNGQNLGLTGFGASAHLVLKMSKYLYPDSRVYVFARKAEEQQFALQLGASWAGNTTDEPPEKLHAIIDTTPAWLPITAGLKQLKPGGRLVINAIRKEAGDQSELQKLKYEEQLWMEKEIKSVANITRTDVRDSLALAAKMKLKPAYALFDFKDANKALYEMRTRHALGAKVLRINP